jgi:hypothetical protein
MQVCPLTIFVPKFPVSSHLSHISLDSENPNSNNCNNVGLGATTRQRTFIKRYSMTTNIKEAINKIIGYEWVTRIFGGWPDFHDSEIVSMSLDRCGRGEIDGPTIYMNIHVFDWEKTEGSSRFNFTRHHQVTLAFCAVEENTINSFNGQNILSELQIEMMSGPQWEHCPFKVKFLSSYGAEGDILCECIEVVSIQPGIPEGSIYG